ncbi:MAG: 3-hydroxyacyl-ACP dehydratase FabZ [Deltaproteobacteria bacterium]|nr:3-hydroxyacyl-ACP dehydratase FabZ [Deltaproteobacteria bacterium]
MILDILGIMDILRHRFPFLLVDRILSIQDGKKIVAVKNVTANEPFFPGHFPGEPIMPGVLIIEAMAQAGAILAIVSDKIPRNHVTYFGGIDNARFRRPVVPGDVLRLELEISNKRRGIYFLTGKAYVDDQLAAEADLKATFALKDLPS